MGRNLIVGDIHSQYGLLMDALEAASFSPSDDTLYSVGDIADRGPETVRLIEFLHLSLLISLFLATMIYGFAII